MTDNERFCAARERVLHTNMTPVGAIGILSEKYQHRILKYYYEPREEYHEIKYLGSVADIKNEEGIIEIQTRAVAKMRAKLEKFLQNDRVTVVLPLMRDKHIFWINRESGEIVSDGMSPKHETVFSSFRELYSIRDLIDNENLTVKLLFLKTNVYKALNRKTGKRHAETVEFIPTDVVEEVEITSTSDFYSYVPKSLFEPFTAPEFARAAHLPKKRISYTVGFLREIGIIERSENRGRAYTYKIVQKNK